MMKRVIQFCLLLCFSIVSRAQVGIGTSTPDSSAQLDVASVSRGFLPPRLTYAQRNAITNPAQGLMIYCSNCGMGAGEPQYYNGYAWLNFNGTPASIALSVGDDYGGGKVAYIFEPGDTGFVAGEVHGLIAAAADLDSLPTWGCINAYLGANKSEMGGGKANTITIMNGCTEAGIAAAFCDALELNGFSDWYLPSLEELSKLYINRIAIGGFGTVIYWSSTEEDADRAVTYPFDGGIQTTDFKTASHNVRAVRTF